MLGKLVIANTLIAAAALLGASSSIGSRHAGALCFGSPATITGSGTIIGTAGDDVIIGSDGNDIILGLGGNDKICGGAGDDTLGGGPGDDQLDGGPGNDTLSGGPGTDVLLGGEGDDSMQCGTGTDTADGGPGTNIAVTTGDEACETVTNASPPPPPPTPTDATCFGSPATITGSGPISGTPGDDVIVGSDGNDSIKGYGGNDKICGGAGDDKIGGGPGNDQISGGRGNDNLSGGWENDTIIGGDGNDAMQGGPGTDTCDGGPGTNTAVPAGFEACETFANADPLANAPTTKLFTLNAPLAVGQEVRRPKGTRGATGLFKATLTASASGATINWRLSFSHLTGRVVVARLYNGLPGHAGPILVRLCGPCRAGAHGTVHVSGLPALRALVFGEAYVNVQTKRNPGGEIRGQIGKVAGGG
jgi:Ca2+-binding RTX toxin-like protein